MFCGVLFFHDQPLSVVLNSVYEVACISCQEPEGTRKCDSPNLIDGKMPLLCTSTPRNLAWRFTSNVSLVRPIFFLLYLWHSLGL